MKLIDPSQRINVLWDNDDGTRYTEEMTIRRLLAVMSDDEVETITVVRCGECKHSDEDEPNYCNKHMFWTGGLDFFCRDVRKWT